MIDRGQWRRLSALLDEGVAVSSSKREAWLRLIEPIEPLLVQPLRGMLERIEAGDSMREHGIIVFSQFPHSAPSATEAHCLTDTYLGTWRLQRQLGEGRIGQVWLAKRSGGQYDAYAAVKVLQCQLAATALRAALMRERTVMARLNHPDIARLLDAGVNAGVGFLVLEYVGGRSLLDHAAHHCPTLASRVRLLIQVARVVNYAHLQQLIHGDLKPNNVQVTAEGRAILLDFGISRLLQDNELKACEARSRHGLGFASAYAAPEQIAGDPITTATDTFSLGVMLFELLSDRLPFSPSDFNCVVQAYPMRRGEVSRPLNSKMTGSAPRRAVDLAKNHRDLDAIVSKALRKDPRERYPHAGALIEDLERWLTYRVVSARRGDLGHHALLWLRRNLVIAATVALVASCLLGGLATTAGQCDCAKKLAPRPSLDAHYLR